MLDLGEKSGDGDSARKNGFLLNCSSARIYRNPFRMRLKKSDALRIPISKLTTDEIQKKCHTREHQGLAAKMPLFPYTPFEELPEVNTDESSLLLILDSIQDPHNLGAIIRTAEVLGSSGIIIGQTNQAGVSSQVVRSSAGAVNHLPIVLTDDLEGLIRECQSKKYSVIAASEKSEAGLESFELPSRTILMIGNEGTGIRRELLELADGSVSIRQSGKTESLNAAISASILIYEYHRQQDAS